MADKRTFRYALLASLALHLLLLLPPGPVPARSESRSPALTAHLVPPDTPIGTELKKQSSRPRVAKALPPMEVPEAVSRDQYRIELMSAAVRHARERYPQLARENKWEGDVRVGIVVSASGRTTLTLKASSGYEVLDERALDLLREAARSVALPHALRGRDFAVEVRATYRLGD